MSKSNTIKEFIASTDLDRDAAFEAFASQYGHSFTRRGDFNHLWKLAKGQGPQTAAIGRSVPKAEDLEFKITTGRKEAEHIDPRIRVVMPTGTAFDTLVSKRGGVQRGTVTMVTGESGAGKTTICTNIATYIAEQNPDVKVGFISGEMDQNDWDEECADNENLMDLETLFLLDYLDNSNFLEILERALGTWDYVVVDSFEAILDQIKEVTTMNTKQAEAYFIKILRKVAREKAVALFVIQQYTKGGSYVGSTKIKHLTTGMIYVMFGDNNERYLIYVKNRRNGSKVGMHLYFSKDNITGRLKFDNARLETQLVVSNFTEQERETLNKEANAWDEMFLNQEPAQEDTTVAPAQASQN